MKPDWVVVDCRFFLDKATKGYQDYLESHIPGALYFDLEKDLSGPVVTGVTGRHPLPDPATLAEFLGSQGIDNNTQVIAYDDLGGMMAGRLWWLLRWLGHENVAVLDGGYPAWIAEERPVSAELPKSVPKCFIPKVQSHLVATAADVLENFGDPGKLLIDSRAPDRFSGENEPIDPVAGRIPGAINYHFAQNLDLKGFFEIKDVLRGRFTHIFRDIPVEDVIFYCGSGVSAAHNVLAVAHAGLGMAKIYSGSWSHWITDPQRPITRDH